MGHRGHENKTFTNIFKFNGYYIMITGNGKWSLENRRTRGILPILTWQQKFCKTSVIFSSICQKKGTYLKIACRTFWPACYTNVLQCDRLDTPALPQGIMKSLIHKLDKCTNLATGDNEIFNIQVRQMYKPCHRRLWNL